MKKLYVFQATFLLGLIFMSNLSTYSHSKEISRAQYFFAFGSASDATEAAFPRRNTVTREEFKDGKSVVKITKTFEYLAADRFRGTTERSVNGKSEVGQYLQVGKSYYCKEGNRAWKKSPQPCIPITMMSGQAPDKREYTMENLVSNGEQLRVFRMYEAHSWPKDGSSEPIEYYFEQIFTVDSAGLLTHIDIKEGRVTGSQIDSKQTETYEYNVRISRIDPPLR